MDRPVRVPQMSVTPHHPPPPLFVIDIASSRRSPSLQTTTPLSSPTGTLTPFVHRETIVSSPDRAHFRDSLLSKPSISEASQPPSSPSISGASFNSDGPSRAIRAESSRRSNGHSHHSSRHSQRRSNDVEKFAGSRSPTNPRRSQGPSTVISDITTVTLGYNDRDERSQLEGKALRILVYLSTFAPAVSFLIAVWTLLALVLLILAQPLRIIKSRPPPSSELAAMLSPSLRLQLRLIYSTASSNTYNAPMLLVINILSSFVSMGVAFAEWVAACFWFFSAILGDPAGRDGHNDGKAAVLGIRGWWERWLCRALR